MSIYKKAIDGVIAAKGDYKKQMKAMATFVIDLEKLERKHKLKQNRP